MTMRRNWRRGMQTNWIFSPNPSIIPHDVTWAYNYCSPISHAFVKTCLKITQCLWNVVKSHLNQNSAVRLTFFCTKQGRKRGSLEWIGNADRSCYPWLILFLLPYNSLYLPISSQALFPLVEFYEISQHLVNMDGSISCSYEKAEAEKENGFF